MVDSSRTIMTDAGFALETRVRADETKMQFTRAAISTDDHFSDTDDALAKLTELSNIQQDGKVTAVQVINTTTVYVQVDVNQAESKADYQMRSAALYAKDDDGTEVLYGVTVLQDPVFVHKDADGSYLGFGINTTVGRASNVVVVVDPANMVTQQVFESTMKNYYTKAEVDAKFVTDDDFASKLPRNIATTDAANTFAKSQTLAGGATDGKGNAYATTKDVATGLKNGFNTKVNVSDMRKPASDVAGIEEVNAVDAKSLARNLISNSGYMVNLDGWKGTNGGNLGLITHYFYRGGTENLIQLNNTKTSEVFASSGWFKVKPNTQYTFQFILFGTSNTTSTDVWLIGQGTNATSIISGYVQSPSKAELITKTFTTGNFEDAYIRVDNNGSKDGNNCYIAFTEVQLEEGTVVHPWTPSFSDLVHRVADNGDGSIRVNGNSYTPADDSTVIHNNALNQILTDNSGIIIGNDKDFGFIKRQNYKGGLAIGSSNSFHFMATHDSALSNTSQYYNVWNIAPTGKLSILDGAYFTPSDDSKVAHLSGANNFDTVPTVNNNPLLLASSLPSDLARTGQDANFTAKLQQNGQDVALANNTIARNPDTGVVSEPTDFTKLTVNGGKSVATSDDLKSLEASAWRPLTLENANNGAILFKDNGDGTASLTGSANFVIAAASGVITEAIDPPSGYQFSSLAWNKGTDGDGIFAIGGRSGTSAGPVYTPTALIQNGKICFKGGSYSYPELMFSPCLNTTDKTSSSCEPAIVGITKI